MADVNEFNAKIIEEFRANNGVVGGPFEGASLLLLATTGARSGEARVTPVVYRSEGERLFVFASKAGAPTNPDWYHNLVAHPRVTVEVGTETVPMVATVLDEEERSRVYAAHAALNPGFAEYQAATDRVIPVVALDRS
jgi:deazaflavin-dependent oxidoreductase (nitroreductase family)